MTVKSFKRMLRPRQRLRSFWVILRSTVAGRLGWRGTFDHLVSIVREVFCGDSREFHVIRVKGLRRPVVLRCRSSDTEVFKHIFLEEEYRPLARLRHVKTVIDCGANVGLSTLWFLRCFPACHVIAVEPDPDNFSVLALNASAYPERVTLVNAAVWSDETPVALRKGAYRDGKAWSTQVAPAADGAGSLVNTITISRLLDMTGATSVSLLKIDIEGAETMLFDQAATQWLARVDACAIELHPDSPFGNPVPLFEQAVRNHSFTCLQSGEVTICTRVRN